MYGTCKICGCTDHECSQCVKKTGMPCWWLDESHELCSACVDPTEKVNLMELKSFNVVDFIMEASKEDLSFIDSFISKLGTFKDDIKHASPNYSGYTQTIVRIRNVDLWIDSVIEARPELQSFRDYVLDEMKKLDIPLWPDYIYKDGNHYKIFDKRK